MLGKKKRVRLFDAAVYCSNFTVENISHSREEAGEIKCVVHTLCDFIEPSNSFSHQLHAEIVLVNNVLDILKEFLQSM